MNWVERQYQHEQAIRSELEPFWRDLCAALVEAVHSFNQLYRASPKASVKEHVRTDAIEFSCQLPLQGVQVEKIRHATATFALDVEGLQIKCFYLNSKAKPFELRFDFENGLVFLRGADGSRIEDADTTSRQMMQTFLFGLPLF